MDIPETIKKARKKLFKSAAMAADCAGISRSHWSNFESGGRTPMPDNVEAIAKTIKLTNNEAIALLRAAIQRHESEVTKKLIANLEGRVAKDGDQIIKLQGQLRDVVLLLRNLGVELPKSIADVK